MLETSGLSHRSVQGGQGQRKGQTWFDMLTLPFRKPAGTGQEPLSWSSCALHLYLLDLGRYLGWCWPYSLAHPCLGLLPPL